jgi:hypothetical protein
MHELPWTREFCRERPAGGTSRQAHGTVQSQRQVRPLQLLARRAQQREVCSRERFPGAQELGGGTWTRTMAPATLTESLVTSGDVLPALRQQAPCLTRTCSQRYAGQSHLDRTRSSAVGTSVYRLSFPDII